MADIQSNHPQKMGTIRLSDFSISRILVDAWVYFEHVQEIRPRSVEGSRDVENETNSKGLLRAHFSNTAIFSWKSK
jgi:hypothetical protein